MAVLPLYPLYPDTSFLEFNTSLSIPGINLWKLRNGNCIKDLEYPNSKTLLLLPDIDYIRKFANYDLGIADSVLKASLLKNLTRTRDINIQRDFSQTFKNIPTGSGLKALETTIISSIFESYKPYFTIAQLVTENIIDIEDIIARLAVLTSPLIILNPFGVKSRKPIGNSGDFGTPAAMGYKNGEIIKEAVNEFKRVSKKGLDIKIDSDGKSTVTKRSRGPEISIGGETRFDYVTVSTVYSTGVFRPEVEYNYQYIDIIEEDEPQKDPLSLEDEIVDNQPSTIILGVFDIGGKPVNPNNPKLNWILSNPKWILNKSIDYPNIQSWRSIDENLYHWRRFGQIRIQKESPGFGWQRLNYGDVMDFDKKDNENSKYKKDDPIISVKPTDIEDFKKFFDSKLEMNLVGKKLDKDQESFVREQVTKIYMGESKTQPGQLLINEHIQNLIQFSKLNKTPYITIDKKDRDIREITIFNKENLVFKPMRFRLSTGDVWIDPETEYDYKIIKLVPKSNVNNPSNINKPFSKGRYGDGSEENPQSYGYLERRKVNEFDNETFFIIEAVKKSDNKTFESAGKKEDGDGFYRLPDALGVIPILINLAIKVFTKLIPEITKLISLLTNPAQFVIDIVTQKIKDPVSGFTFFSDEAIKILGDLPKLSSRVKEGLIDVSEMISLVKQSPLGNYIHVDLKGDWKFLLNGEGTTDFLGIMFGVKVDFMSPTPIKPIIDTKGFGTFGSIFNTKCGEDDVPKRPTYKADINTQKLGNDGTDSVNVSNSSVGGDTYQEEVSIKYSTGQFVEGVNYKYIYIDQETTRLISEADELANLENKNLENTPEQLSSNLEEALRKYQTALEKERNKDAKDRNGSLIKLLMEKINSIRQKLNILIQPIFKMVFGLVSMPLKLILKIINCILDFFKSLFENPLLIPVKIAEFLSFNWLTKLFKPAGLLFLAGIDFAPEKLAMWSAAIAGKIDLEDIPLADLKDFLFSAYQMVLPEYSESQFKDLLDKPFRVLVPTLTLFQKIINAVIMLIWSIFGISAVLPPPLMCNKYDIDDSDLSDLLSGLFKDNQDSGDGNGNGDSYTFVYEVKLGDGTTRELNAEELQKFLEENKDTNFDFENFKTIE